MNTLKAWNAKLEAALFWPSKNLYRQCVGFMLHTLPIQRVAEYAKKLASNFSEASEIREQGPFHLTFYTIYNCTFCYE